MVNHPNRNITTYQAGEIIRKVSIRAATATHAISDFKGTGIFPLDTNVIQTIFMLYIGCISKMIK